MSIAHHHQLTRAGGPADRIPPLTIRPEWLELTRGVCPSCRGAMPVFRVDLPDSLPPYRGFSWGLAGAYEKYTNLGQSPARTCRVCSFRRYAAYLCGSDFGPSPRIASPEVLEVEALRAELRALKAEKPVEPEPVPIDVMIATGPVLVTRSVREAKPLKSTPTQWAALVDEHVDRHRRGHFGAHGTLPITVLAETRKLGPVASIEQQNGAAFLDGSGSVRSEYSLRPHPPGYPASRMAAQPSDTLRIWTELSLPATLVYRPSDSIEVDR